MQNEHADVLSYEEGFEDGKITGRGNGWREGFEQAQTLHARKEADGMYVLSNAFHGTEYRTRKSPLEVYKIASTPSWQRTTAEKAWVRRVWKRLCGVEGCTCGDELGRRSQK